MDNTSAVLEQVRRLEGAAPFRQPDGEGAAGPHRSGGERRLEKRPGSEAKGRDDRQAAGGTGAADERSSRGERGAQPLRQGTEKGQETVWRQGPSTEGEGAALREQLERLDRALLWRESTPWGGDREMAGERGAAFPLALERPGGGLPGAGGEGGSGWMPEVRLEGTGPAAAGPLDWAEQADQVFRRDSRRYDGGFYLY